MEKEIRFASIPRCGSRSLKALGLLGELDGRCHTQITEYPDWESFRWMRVDRPAEEWYASWWAACRDMRSLLAHEWGFRYESMEVDLALLGTPDNLPAEAPQRWGLNQWVPADLRTRLRNYLDQGRDFKDLCIDTICDGVVCDVIPLAGLEEWLMMHGFTPRHENQREYARL